MNPSVAKVTCPTCKMSGDWFATPCEPFCSERCKLIDPGKWLGGEQVISKPLRPEHLERYADLSTDGHKNKPDPADN